MSKKWYPLLFKCALITEQHSKGETYVAICLDHYMVAQGDFAEEAKENLAVQLWIQDNVLNDESTLRHIEPFPYNITKARYYGRFIEYFTIDLNEIDIEDIEGDETKRILYRATEDRDDKLT